MCLIRTSPRTFTGGGISSAADVQKIRPTVVLLIESLNVFSYHKLSFRSSLIFYFLLQPSNTSDAA